ncbi:MAG: hypothetical protein WED04_03815 [Promethearchaeati archaeon SRVP18_Atabeyarchaeia-1]
MSNRRSVLIVDDLEFNPESYEFERNNKQVKLTITKPLEDLVIAGKDLASVAKGQDVTLPLWAAEALAKANAGVMREEQKLAYKDFENILWKEQLETPLQKLPEDFYVLAKELAKSFQEKVSNAARDLDSVRRLAQFETLLRDLVSVRISKIVKISLRGGDALGTSNLMTGEEAWLYQRLAKLLRGWEKGILQR